ncbi:spondin-1-like isoform X3 [Symsagittifera roscoffensis]|uniref:spondin-1-like isoform X3 n=1 Tax=Symsagittifera roscoffensis TaxID=84072 RepID=UPI00307B4B2E
MRLYLLKSEPFFLYYLSLLSFIRLTYSSPSVRGTMRMSPLSVLLSLGLVLCGLGHVGAMPDGNPGHWCSRFPGGHEVEALGGDNGYFIEVRHATSKLVVNDFVPSHKYEVSIATSRDPFKGFAIVSADPSSSFNEEQYLGHFEVLDSKTTKSSSGCKPMMTHVSASEKQFVTMLWYAPENTFEQPCVQFRATVVKTKTQFYMDEGNLTKKICKKTSSPAASGGPDDSFRQVDTLWGEVAPDKGSAADYLATNPQIRQCCACGRANYRINFAALWDQQTDVNGKTPFDNIQTGIPLDFYTSSEREYITPKWQSLIGASHDETFSLWRYEEQAPEHMRADMSLASGRIQPRNIQNFLKENFRSVRTVIRMPDIADAKGDASAQFSVDKKFHLASFLAFISPSPDWFVGFNSVDLCDQDCTWKDKVSLSLYPIDAGTHSGDNFLSSREELVTRQKIQDLRYLNRNNSDSPFFEQVRNSIPRFASVDLIRTAVRDDACQASNYNPAFSANYDPGFAPAAGDEATDPSRYDYADEHIGEGSLDTNRLCMWSEWSDWGECEASSRNGVCSQWGTQKRSRSSSSNPVYCNVNSGLAEEQTTCVLQLGPECAKDCVVGQWTEWSSCSGGTCRGGGGERGEGRQTRQRSIYEQAQFGGKACPGDRDLADSRYCKDTRPC